MNPHAKTSARSTASGTLAALACVLMLAACAPEASAPIDPPLAGSSIGGPFELVNSAGETVRWDDFAGKYRVVYFGFAYCPDICPTDMQRIAQGMKTLEESDPELAARVQPIFITVDPARDTPEVVGEFTSAFSDDIIGLTGTQAQVDKAVEEFAVYAARGEETPDGGYLMEHSRITYLFGPEGEPIAPLPTDQPGREGAQAFAAEIRKWAS
ncbi:protein SCO1/2 [Erythrobacter litoralis]|jgi:protein SCO1/2|uniref:Electron transporter n=1 Tax=Erythrobacter litoralis TaxID=39960 RepID=A0A074N5E7_9SPHN|nr:SCO family protein [Erythrobacter litoralis]AOL24574.1 protein SCO1/2 [Erythrobacter litoralis]KEO93187.1 electron transporter [Erythrobacter litoralis]MEE4337162.1 SCO family protein [Erythrobacter sp.]